VHRPIPTSSASSSRSARVIDLEPEPSLILAVWWVALHALATAALVVVGAPWPLKGLALLVALVHSVALRPEPAPRMIYRGGGRVTLPELGDDELTLGPATLYSTIWIKLDLRGKSRKVEVLLFADQVDTAAWRALQAELRRLRSGDGNESAAK
jgi:hypothetical protein